MEKHGKTGNEAITPQMRVTSDAYPIYPATFLLGQECAVQLYDIREFLRCHSTSSRVVDDTVALVDALLERFRGCGSKDRMQHLVDKCARWYVNIAPLMTTLNQ
jgi:hypothetical protein